MKATTIKASRKASAGVKHALLILLSFIAVFPLYWMIEMCIRDRLYSWALDILCSGRER